jgi:hypothetical protein
MKSHSFRYTFFVFLLLLFLIIPPLFFANHNSALFSQWNFPSQQLILFFIALLIYVFFIDKASMSKIKFIYNIFYSIFFLCILFAFSLLIRFFSTFFISVDEYKIVPPRTFRDFSFCVLNFLFSAFYEESIYRIAFPEYLILLVMDIAKKITKKDISNKMNLLIKYVCDFFAILIFSFSHLYLGIFSIINAAFAQVILRICYKKTDSIIPGTFAHFVYNLISVYI